MRLFPQISRPVKVAILLIAIAGVAVGLGSLALASLNPGPRQPIPFSHRIHVETKKIDCFFCHQYAARSSNPGMPSVEKCLLCHNVIASQFPPIAKIRDYYRRGVGIPWVRVAQVPDFVRFSHQVHLARGVDCSRCHGDIRSMDRVKLVNRFDMNFCVTCHFRSGASVDCYVCHY